jgi:hypothetical protein
MKGIKPQFPNGVVNSVSFVSTTNTASSLAGFVVLALALTSWRFLILVIGPPVVNNGVPDFAYLKCRIAFVTADNRLSRPAI